MYYAKTSRTINRVNYARKLFILNQLESNWKFQFRTMINWRPEIILNEISHGEITEAICYVIGNEWFIQPRNFIHFILLILILSIHPINLEKSVLHVFCSVSRSPFQDLILLSPTTLIPNRQYCAVHQNYSLLYSSQKRNKKDEWFGQKWKI